MSKTVLVLAGLARARMRTKLPALRDALVGRFTDHHAFLCRTAIDAISARIEEELQPLQPGHFRNRVDPAKPITSAAVLIGRSIPRRPVVGLRECSVCGAAVGSAAIVPPWSLTSGDVTTDVTSLRMRLIARPHTRAASSGK